MQTILRVGIVVSLAIYYLIWYWGHRGHRQIARGMRAVNAIDAIMASYKAGDYAGALQSAQLLKQDRANAQDYYYFSGAMLHHMRRLHEAEDFLRKAIPLQKEPRLNALAANTLGLVLLDQGRYEEAIASHEESLRLWPDRGSSYRAIAEALLRQKREPARALHSARPRQRLARPRSPPSPPKSSAAFVLASVFGDDTPFTVTSDVRSGTRAFPSERSR